MLLQGLNNVNTPEQLVDHIMVYGLIPYAPRGDVEQMVDLLMQPGTKIIAKFWMWNGARYFNILDKPIYYGILRLKALKVIQYVLDRYIPNGCIPGRIPISIIMRDSRDIKFIYQT